MSRTVTVELYEDVETDQGDAEREYRGEVTVYPRFPGTYYDPPEGGPELEQLWIDGIEIKDPWNGEYDDVIARLEELAEEIVDEEKYGDGREL